MEINRPLGYAAAFLGTIVLCMNTYILGRSAMEWAHASDDGMRIAYAVCGGVIPWFLALIPMFMGIVSVARTWAQKLLRFLIILGLWAFFFLYNLVMGASTATGLRESKVAEHSHQIERLDITRERRKQLKAKLASLPAHRPSATVTAEIEAVKISKPFTNANDCTDPTTKQQRETCQNYERLKGEYAAAVEAEAVEKELKQLDDAIGSAPTVADAGDPFSDFLFETTGFAQRSSRAMQAMATPVAIEIIGAVSWHFAAIFLGWRIKRIEDDHAPGPKKGGSTPEEPAPRIPPKDGLSRPMEASLGIITRQRSICENFFKNCTRHSRDGHLPEREWFEHYTAICERSHDNPLPIESFRRIAATYVPSIQQLDGVTYYSGVLPLVRNDA